MDPRNRTAEDTPSSCTRRSRSERIYPSPTMANFTSGRCARTSGTASTNKSGPFCVAKRPTCNPRKEGGFGGLNTRTPGKKKEGGGEGGRVSLVVSFCVYVLKYHLLWLHNDHTYTSTPTHPPPTTQPNAQNLTWKLTQRNSRPQVLHTLTYTTHRLTHAYM